MPRLQAIPTVWLPFTEFTQLHRAWMALRNRSSSISDHFFTILGSFYQIFIYTHLNTNVNFHRTVKNHPSHRKWKGLERGWFKGHDILDEIGAYQTGGEKQLEYSGSRSRPNRASCLVSLEMVPSGRNWEAKPSTAHPLSRFPCNPPALASPPLDLPLPSSSLPPHFPQPPSRHYIVGKPIYLQTRIQLLSRLGTNFKLDTAATTMVCRVNTIA